MLKVLIADDYEIIRTGIRHILQEEFTLAEIGEAFDTPTLIEMATLQDWDIIISDISMPGGGGLEALKKILEKKPDQKILIITVYSQEQYASRVINAGACGFLNKDTAPDELVTAIKMVLSGQRYLPPDIADKMRGI